MFSWQIGRQILEECFEEVKQEVQKMSDVAEIDAVGVATRCIASHPFVQSYHVRKHIMSAGWVFRGWVGWSRWFKNNYGVYPDQKYPGIVAKLARMPKSVRDKIIMPELVKMEG